MKNIINIWGSGKDAAALCKTHDPEAARDYIARANDICENQFIFRDHWEMEKTNEPVQFAESIDWFCKPGEDSEWTFAFSRHSFLLVLAKAYALTGDEKYITHYTRLVLDWIKAVPLTDAAKKTTWRSIEAGLRCENWLKSMMLIKDCKNLPVELFAEMDACLRIHAEYLVEAHGDFQRLSNWGVLQDRGLFLAGIYFAEQRYIDLTLKRLSDNLRLQVLPDGIHWEQSPQYHAEVLQCFLTVTQAAMRCNVALPKGFADAVHRMAKALSLWIKPNGRLICQSDSDNVDARDVLVQAAVLFSDAELKTLANNEFFDGNIWNMGIDAIKQYQDMKALPHKPRSIAFPQSGNYILRDENNFLHMHCGSLGSGHGHADLLHIDLFAHGKDILIDSGRFSYVDSAIRHELKSPAAHNTITVDGKDFSVYKNSWDYSKISMPIKGEYFFAEQCGFISGGHLGYLQEGVFVFRKVVQAAPGLFIIFDELYAEGNHTYTQHFHFNNEGEVMLDGSSARYEGKSAHAKLIVLTPDANLSLIDVPLSRTYNELEQGRCLRVDCKEEGFAGLVTVISTAPVNSALNVTAELIPVTLTRNGETVPNKKAQAVKINKENDEYTVICLHEEIISEVGLIEANGHKGYGKVMVFAPNNTNGITLAW
ncbi:MAG: heparinase II/III family protein [Treponema sp.]|nr:heparinase II/III family protein [Treponema sp.]